MSETDLESNLFFIFTNYGFLATVITSLETRGTLLTDAIKIVENVKPNYSNMFQRHYNL